MRITMLTLFLPLQKSGNPITSPDARSARPLIRLFSLLVIVLCAGAGSSARAQEFQAGFDFVTLFPRGEFRQNIDNNGYGGGGQFLVRLKKSPFLVGADLGFANYGTESRRESISTTIPEVELKVSTTNNIFWTHAVLRAQPSSGKVRPYVDGLIGLKYLYTDTSITSDVSTEALASTTNFSDTAISYGVGGGVQIYLANTGKRSQVVFDTKLRYLRGGEAGYLKKGSIIRQDGQVFFDVLRSRTDVLALHIGVTFRF